MAWRLLKQSAVYQLDIASLSSVAALRPEERRRFRVSQTILLLGCVSCLTDISSEMVSSILPIYMLVQLQLSPLQFGIIDGLYQGVGAVARLGSGLLADRWHRHKLVAGIGYGMSALCKLGLLVLPGSAASLATMIAIDRTGKGVRTAPRDAMISLNAPPSNLAAGFAVHRAFDTAGVIIGPLVAYVVLKSISDGFDVVFAVSFAAALIGLAVLVLLVDSPGASRSATTSFRTMMAACADPQFRTVLTAGAFWNLTVMSDAFLYLILQRHGASAIENLPLFFITTAVAYLALAIPAGRLADRVGRARVYLGGHVIVASLYAVVLAVPLNTTGVIACLLVYGAYYAATDGVLSALVSGIVRRDSLGTSLGTVGTATSLARLCGSVLFGALWAWRGPSAAVTFALIGTIVVAICFSRRLLALDRRPSEAVSA